MIGYVVLEIFYFWVISFNNGIHLVYFEIFY